MSAEPTAVQTGLPTGTWKVDPVHSHVEFSVRHLGIATVKGQFREFQGTLEVTPEGASASGSAKVASVDTREEQRDGHLRSPDFFDADQFPEITFKSTSIGELSGESFDITGDLTIHGVTQSVTFKGTLGGTETDQMGNPRVGLEASTTVSREDFGMKFNMALGSGNAIVSDKVKIELEISAVKSD